jgi:hypothetical protein
MHASMGCSLASGTHGKQGIKRVERCMGPAGEEEPTLASGWDCVGAEDAMLKGWK